MSDVNDGGSAFPTNGGAFGSSGMSLRDWFAGMAMQGDWAAQSVKDGMWSNQVAIGILQDRAVVYYRMADAMLKAREVKS